MRVAVAAGMLLVATLLQPAPAHAADEFQVPPTAREERAAKPGQVLVRQRVTLTQSHRPKGFVAPNDPARRLAGARIDIEVLSSLFIHAHVDLVAAPATDDDALLSVQFGNLDAKGQCHSAPDADEWEWTEVGLQNYHLFGYSPNSWGPRPAKPWECVRVFVSLDGATPHDVLEGPLVNTYEAPRLSVGKVSVLGQKQARLKVAKGGWTPVEVTVANTGDRHSDKVTVTGKGRGLKVKADSIDAVREGESGSAVIRVRPKGTKKPKRLTLTARSAGGVVTKRTIKVKRVKPPRRPVAGQYRNKAGTVRFRIRKGRVVGFSVTTQTRCGGYGTVPTYTQNTYDFPTRKIPRNGILTASAKGRTSGASWGTQVRMKVAGGKVTRGLFKYGGPGGCSAVAGFTANRRGR